MKLKLFYLHFVGVLLFLSMFAKCNASIRIMPLGDSITEGISGSTNDIGYRRALYLSMTNSGYDIDFVGSQVHGKLTDFDRNHEGHGGWRADRIRDNVLNWLISNPADIVLLHIGTNDLWHDLQPAVDVAGEVNQILDIIDTYEATYNTPITVVLAQIIDLDHNLASSAQIQVTADYYGAIEDLYNTRLAAGDRIALVDMYNALTYPADMYDVAHPNDNGYDRMAEVWYEKLVAIMDGSVYHASLDASSLAHTTNDSLICSYTLGSSDTTAAVSWFKSGSPIMNIYLPMEGGNSNALLDYSGNNVNCSIEGNVTWSDISGFDGYGAYLFNGGYIKAGESLPANGSYTKTAWVYRTGSAENIISGDSDDGGHVFWLSDNVLNAGHNKIWDAVHDSESLSLNTWYFVAVSFNAETGEMILYKNGVEIDRAAGISVASDSTVLVGAFKNGHIWNGSIDDVRIYNSALSTEQISAMYNNGEGNIGIVMPQETSDGESWQAKIVPFLSSQAGDVILTNTVFIGNSSGLDNLGIGSDSGQNLSDEDIFCSYELTGTAITAATAWYKGNAPMMNLYMPMEGGQLSAVNDYSGNGGKATSWGNPTWYDTAGHDGNGAFMFDGIDDRLDAGEKFPIRSSYTKTAWVYRTSDGGDNNIISGDNSSSSHVLWAPASYGYKLSAGHNGAWSVVQDSTALNKNTWYFVAVSFNAETGEMILYRDGSEVDRGIASNDVTDATIAISSFNNGHVWFGSIDDVRVYSSVLSEKQISTMFNNNSVGDIIVSDETDDGESWYAEVTPFSHSEPGVTVKSNTIIIGGEGNLGIANPELYSVSGQNFDSDNIVCNFDLTGNAITAATVWYRNTSPIMNLYLPMEGGPTNALRNLSDLEEGAIPMGSLKWSATGGHDGFGAFTFDGIDDHITAGELFPVNSSYTKTAWVYRTSDNGNNNIISGDIASGGHAFWTPATAGNKLSAGQDNSWFIVQDSMKLETNTWYFVAVSYNAYNGEMVLYKNGIEVDRAITELQVSDSTILVGSHNHGSLWTGTIDDACVYNYALSAEQIHAMYNGNSGNNIIVANESNIGDKWNAAIVPFSNTHIGDSIFTNDITINAKLYGHVTNILGLPVEGVVLTANDGGGDDVTGIDGSYQIAVPYDWSGTISSIKEDYSFTPPVFILPVAINQEGDFIAQLDADIDNSGEVNLSDLQVLCGSWLEPDGFLAYGDLDGNGMIDLRDLAEMARYWNY